jgi:lysylphosphatidylglycerol synthetase-like protein (DUF2156 family)
MTSRPPSVSGAFLLILLNALGWLAFSIIAAAGIHPSLPETGFGRWAMAVLALLNAFVLVGLVILLRRHNRIAYWLALGLITTISVLTLAGEFGPADLIVLMINLLMLLLLVRDRGLEPLAGCGRSGAELRRREGPWIAPVAASGPNLV